ncbi:MAG: tRNA 2-thiouridine(34) synthase MnmA [Candidatus Sulfobium sp.]|jgi:tRNA-specific 2-thiouridylase
MARVIVGMSGGVDSSVTAWLLRECGFDVEGISFVLWEARNRRNPAACCSLEAVEGASETARHLGIGHLSLDVREEFIEKVIDPFVDQYTRGLTPNPCILCNRHIKFPFLLREAERRGAEFIATGHYARVQRNSGVASGEGSGNLDTKLKKSIDAGKDQSYVLYGLRPEELRRLVLPLGEYRKQEVREIARAMRMAAAERPESQEICFIENNNYAAFIENLLPSAGEPGPVLDAAGQVVGTHKGIYRYTLGQRKGLGIASLEPRYVTRIDSERNSIVVGQKEEARIRGILVRDLNWLSAPRDDRFRATVKVRSMMRDRPASVEISNGEARVAFDEPQWAPAPGQSAVFYDGDTVMGGGVITL